MKCKDRLGIVHLVTSQILRSGSAVYGPEKHAEAVQVWLFCGDTVFAPFDEPRSPVNCMTCLVKDER